MSTPIELYNQYLERQGLGEADREAMGLRLVTSDQASKMVGFFVPCPCVFIPYPGSDYYRMRMLGDIPEGYGKYLSARYSGCSPPYLPPTEGLAWSDIEVDTSVGLVVTEGEFKSFTGAKLLGMPVIGLGGVDMQERLFVGDWTWKGRTVAICFDHDEGMPPGEYKPGVANALGRLASRLTHAGAKVVIWNIGAAVEARERKWGLDDYLRAGGDPRLLLGSATAPPEWCKDLAELLDTCVLVRGTNHTHVYNLTNGSRKSVNDFHDAYVEKRRRVIGLDGKPKVEQVSKVWLTHTGRLTVGGYDANPRLPFGVVRGGEGVINLWRGYPTGWAEPPSAEARERVLEGWSRFVEGLFGEHWKWIGLWTGHMLNRPWEGTNQAVMVVTMVQGVGKSLYGDIVRDLCGPHGLERSASSMFNQFNALEESKTFIMVNELDVKFNSKEGQLNDLLSSETVEIEAKGKDVISLPNFRRWYFTTNTSSPCRLSKGQRRVLVVNPPRVVGDTRGEWGRWVGEEVAGWRRTEGGWALGVIREWFDRLWYESGEGDGVWNSTRPVPETEAGREAAEASMTVNQIIAEALFELGDREGWDGVICAHPDLVRLYPKAFGDLTALVKAHGGYSGYKVIKREGKLWKYRVWDRNRVLQRKVDSTGGNSFEMDSEVVLSRASSLAAEMMPLVENHR